MPLMRGGSTEEANSRISWPGGGVDPILGRLFQHRQQLLIYVGVDIALTICTGGTPNNLLNSRLNWDGFVYPT